MRRGLVWTAVFLGVVVLLVQFRQAGPVTPSLQFMTPEGVRVRTLYDAVSSEPLCRLKIRAATQSVKAACPQCVIERRSCLDRVEPVAPTNGSFTEFRFAGGHMQIDAQSVELEKSFCAALSSAPGLKSGSPSQDACNSVISTGQQDFTPMTLYKPMLWSVITAFVISLLIVLTQRWHLAFTADHPRLGVQKVHTGARPRVGGLAVAVGLLLGLWQLSQTFALDLPFGLLSLIAAAPVFAAGFIEDLTKQTSSAFRLWSAMISGLLAWWLTGISLNRLDIGTIDHLLVIAPAVTLALTCFAVAGLSNAINIIDGQHGLAAGTVTISLMGMSAVAHQQSDVPLMLACITVAAASLGFLMVNYPRGRLFLGDAGAYVLGFFMAWFAIALVYRNTGVSAWAVLTICGYPVIETIYSMARRAQTRLRVDEPDRAHLHSLIKTRIVSSDRWRQFDLDTHNALVAPGLWAWHGIFVWLATQLSERVDVAVGLFSIQCLSYWLIYRTLHSPGRRVLHP
jgi:UDP-N-acetylmuramyl pentapeptide phosphotransferase/UDP-N-acetylglucosamine-1-phosphate transferase